MTKKIAPKPKEAAVGGGGGDRVVVKQAQIEAAKQKAKEQRIARKAQAKSQPAAAKHAGKGR